MSSRRVRAEEDRIFGRLRSMFSGWLGSVGNAVLRPFRSHGSWPDPTALYSTTPQWVREVDALVNQDLLRVARIGWSEMTGQVTFSSTGNAVTEALRTSQNLLTNIPDEVHALIAAEIADGLVAGEDPDRIVARVDRFLSTTENSHWNSRAEIIATTETTRAANAGAMAAVQAVEPALGTMIKRWNDSSDQRVRATHREVDGEELLLNQPFMVGGFPMMFPGDPTGPPEEVVSCRCDLSFRRADG